MRRHLLVCSALLAAGCGASNESMLSIAPPASLAIEVGKPFPSLLLPALADGRPASIGQFRGKKTLLHIFASW